MGGGGRARGVGRSGGRARGGIEGGYWVHGGRVLVGLWGGLGG